MSKRLAAKKATAKRRTATEEKKRLQVKLVAGKLMEDPTMALGTAIRAVGMSEFAARNPGKAVTSSPEWSELLDSYLPQGELLETHRGLLRASKIDHLVFTAGDNPSDEEIGEMLADVNCKVRKITHNETARHVYFFAPDNRARKDALEMAYKLRGSFAADQLAVAFSLAALAKLRDPDTMIAAKSSPQLPGSI